MKKDLNMKSLAKLIGILFLAVNLFSCDEESNFKEFDAQLVPVYSLTDISGSSLHAINVYKTLPLIIEYTSEVTAKKYEISSFSDTSNDINFEFSVEKLVDGEVVLYSILGNKETGGGTLTISSRSVNDMHNVNITEAEVYN